MSLLTALVACLKRKLDRHSNRANCPHSELVFTKIPSTHPNSHGVIFVINIQKEPKSTFDGQKRTNMVVALLMLVCARTKIEQIE